MIGGILAWIGFSLIVGLLFVIAMFSRAAAQRWRQRFTSPDALDEIRREQSDWKGVGIHRSGNR